MGWSGSETGGLRRSASNEARVSRNPTPSASLLAELHERFDPFAALRDV